MTRLNPALSMLSLSVLAALVVSTPSAAGTLAAWVQLGPNDGSQPTVSARVITDAGECPVLKADGKPLKMELRAAADAPFDGVKSARFGVRSCQVTVAPDKVTAIAIDDKPLALPRRDPRRIVVIGDTGCRIELENGQYRLQDCNDAHAWPYGNVARRAAEARPDLVIHVGDYLYREDACPDGWTGCKNSPHGLGWDVWNADFFEPSVPLFAAAPWIMVRGNHETCERAGEGWFRFLDHAQMSDKCQPFTDPFVVALENLRLVVMDNADYDPRSGAARGLPEAELKTRVLDQFKKIEAPVAGAWLLTHRPLYGLHSGNPTGYRFDTNALHKFSDPAHLIEVLAKSQMILSGHIHTFEALNVALNHEPGDGVSLQVRQLIVGTGGDNLEQPEIDGPVDFQDQGGLTAKGLASTRFGYMVLDKRGSEWTGRVFDDDGKPIVQCDVVKANLNCTRAH